MSIPTLSIITVVRNGESVIGDCIESIRSQSLPVEHIVIDGNSTDGTLAVLDRYQDRIARIVSEPDQGIYDAMNKGIALAGGDVIGILNADDIYAHGDVLAQVAQVFSEEGVDSCYGDLVYVDAGDTGKVRRYWHSGPYRRERFYQGWMPPHPTFFVRRRVYEAHGVFDLRFGSAADYELMLRLLLRYDISTAYLPHVLVKMRAGGVSNASLGNRLRANRMDRLAWQHNGLTPRPWTLLLKPLSKLPQFFFRP